MENDTERVQSAPEDDDPERLTSKSNTTTADSTRSYGLLKNRLDVNEAGHDPEEEIIPDRQPEITDNPDSNGEDTREENGVLLPEQSNITDDVKTSELECLDDVELPDELIRQLSGVDKIELMSPRSRSLDQENQFELWRRLADVSRRQEEAISWRENHTRRRQMLITRWEKLDFVRRAQIRFYRAKCTHQRHIMDALLEQQQHQQQQE